MESTYDPPHNVKVKAEPFDFLEVKNYLEETQHFQKNDKDSFLVPKTEEVDIKIDVFYPNEFQDHSPVIKSETSVSLEKNDKIIEDISHTGKEFYKCNICAKEFLHESLLKRHYSRYNNRVPFSCSYCKKKFHEKRSFTSHLNCHIKEPIIQKCSICFKTMSKHHLKVHIRRHSYGNKGYDCDYCNKSFVNKNELYLHITRKHIPTADKNFHCTLCKKSFGAACDLKRHIETAKACCIPPTNSQDVNAKKSLVVQKSYRCYYCRKTFCNKNVIKNHILRHLGEKPYKCSVCSKSFTEKGSLKRHLWTHNKNKSYRCPICSKFFQEKLCLRDHVQQVHKKNKSSQLKPT